MDREVSAAVSVAGERTARVEGHWAHVSRPLEMPGVPTIVASRRTARPSWRTARTARVEGHWAQA